MTSAGMIAEFSNAGVLASAARRARERGCTVLDAFTPMAIDEITEAVAPRPSRLPLIMLAGGLLAAALMYFVQWWSAVIDYPIDSGGRPLHSWPAFLVSTFEVGVLGAALSGLAGLLLRTGLPRLNHPVFAIPGFERATQDRFFLALSLPPEEQRDETRRLLAACGALSVSELSP
jgi:hypothetical protein